MAERMPADDGGTTRETVAFDTSTPDVWVAERWTNGYGDRKAALEGRTYEAFKSQGLKAALDWNRCHHSWDDRREQWVVDADALDYLAETAAECGVDVGVATSDVPRSLELLTDVAESGDSISVTYEMKSGGGESTYTGTVVRTDAGRLRFRRADGQRMTVKQCDDGDVGLFTDGSYAPFVGTLVTAHVE